MRIVFNTVLSTIPLFFKEFANAVLIVSGSDSSEVYKENCKTTCKKKCDLICKNFSRRIKVYRYFIDKNLKKLNEDYFIFGSNLKEMNSFTFYEIGMEYDSILVYKK